MISIYQCNPYKQRFFGVLNEFLNVLKGLKTKTFENGWLKK